MMISHSNIKWFGRTSLLDHLFLLLFPNENSITESIVIRLLRFTVSSYQHRNLDSLISRAYFTIMYVF